MILIEDENYSGGCDPNGGTNPNPQLAAYDENGLITVGSPIECVVVDWGDNIGTPVFDLLFPNMSENFSFMLYDDEIEYLCMDHTIFLCTDCQGSESPILINMYSPYGCIDESACNYMESAVFDDESCDYTTCADCAGVPNGDAELDACGICDGDCDGTGSCYEEDECGVCGGYGPSSGYDCNGNCIADIDCWGECGGDAIEDNCGTCDGNPENDCVPDCFGEWGGDLVEDECGVCDGDNSSCSGCTDIYASNYDSEATIDDGSCEYESYFDTIWDELNTTIMAIYIDSAELNGTPLDNGDEICIFDGDACVGVAQLDSPIDETYQIFVPADNPTTSEIDGYIAGNPIAFLYWDVSSQTVYSDIDITIISGSSTYQDFANTTVELSYDTIYGCTDAEACNYSSDANTDDESCEYPDDHHDCDGNCLVELDCAGNCCVIGEDGCYWQETGPCGEDSPSNGMDSCGVCGGDNSSCLDCAGVPCSDAYMDNCGDCDDIPENDCVQDCNGDWGGTAEEDECGVCGGDGIADGTCDCEGNVDAGCDNTCGSTLEFDECGICGGDNSICEGCIDMDACNYEEDAIVDDGSCVLPELGDMNCDYLLNVLDIVTLVQWVLNDNEYYEYADINEDGFVNILDVVILVNWIINGVPVCEGVGDIDGNCYETVQIGDQLWMAENLKVTHYNNGDSISYPSNEDWGSYDEGQYGVYDNDPANADVYGNLYNWAVTVDDRGVCPEGWHVPSDAEYTILTDYLGGESVAGGKMKEAGLDHWNSPNTGATNESGFTGLPAGYRFSGNGSCYYMGNYGSFWSSSELGSYDAWSRRLGYYDSSVLRYAGSKQFGFSIRCLGD